AFFLHASRRLEDRSHLHLGYLREDNAQTTTAMPKHRVRFVKRLDSFPQMLRLNLEFAGQLPRLDFIMRQELVQRGIQRPNGYRQTIHRLEDPLEVLALELEQAGEPSFIHSPGLFDLLL